MYSPRLSLFDLATNRIKLVGFFAAGLGLKSQRFSFENKFQSIARKFQMDSIKFSPSKRDFPTHADILFLLSLLTKPFVRIWSYELFANIVIYVSDDAKHQNFAPRPPWQILLQPTLESNKICEFFYMDFGPNVSVFCLIVIPSPSHVNSKKEVWTSPSSTSTYPLAQAFSPIEANIASLKSRTVSKHSPPSRGTSKTLKLALQLPRVG